MEFIQCESTKSYFVLLHLEIVSQGHHDERIKADKKEKSRIEIGEYHVRCYSMYSTLGKRPFPPDRSCRQGRGLGSSLLPDLDLFVTNHEDQATCGCRSHR
jgi:hypothetical protein